MAKKAIDRIFRNSPYKQRIYQRINIIGQSKISYQYGNQGPMLVLPIDMNKRKQSYNPNFISISNFLDILKQKKDEKVIVRLEHPMEGLENIKFLRMYNYETKKMYTTYFNGNEQEYLSILSEIDYPLVFIQTKLFRKLKGRIWGITRQIPVYIISEINIAQSLDFIEKNYKRAKYYYIDQREYVILVIYRKKYVFIAYIIESAKKDIDEIFKTKLNMIHLKEEESEIDREKVVEIAKTGMWLMEESYNLPERDKTLSPEEVKRLNNLL